jgi:hypothetical protein
VRLSLSTEELESGPVVVLTDAELAAQPSG